jgi:ATP-binding cassette subfamily B protein
VWELVVLQALFAVASGTISRLITLADSLLADRFGNHVSLEMMRHASSLDLASFEDPDFYDKMERARRQAAPRLGMLASLAGMARQLITLLSMISVVAFFSPWLVLLLFVGTLPVFLSETKLAWLNYSLLFRQTPERRHLDYLRYLGASSQSAKEVKIFGLGPYLSERLSTLFERFYAENKHLAVHRAAHGALVSVVPTASYYIACSGILLRALAGQISVGDLTFFAGAFSRADDIMENLVNGLVDVSEQALYVKDLFDYFATKPKITSPLNAVLVPRPFRQGYEFRDVSFAYPGSERKVLRKISFCFCPGERIALVGNNGAGKTTLVKLLARLYDPTDGRILLDGVDLRDYNLEDLRRNIAVIFQDYMRYDMPAAENIGLGDIEEMGSMPRVAAAAEKSQAAPFILEFPKGYKQMLGRRFEGGVDLSIGQWQKIALARAYMREAEILILDEPTASLDASSEFEIYRQFSDLTSQKMAVLISHRFSTVRMADRILVLEKGRIVEEGSHEQLVGLGGTYATLFELQAASYR